jgi:glucans biosynthesis protein C
VVISALIYLPMAARFEPWQWIEYGPFAFQPGLAPQYVLYFLAGLAAGALGIERSFPTSNTLLAERWVLWLVGAFAAFLLWVAAAALIIKGQDVGLPGVSLARDLGVVMFPTAATLGSAAIFLRFSDARMPFLASISENAYGIYLFHYVFVIWTQYLLLGAPLPAIAKGAIVLIITLALSWTISLGVSSIPLGARVLRGERRASLTKAQPPAERSSPI